MSDAEHNANDSHGVPIEEEKESEDLLETEEQKEEEHDDQDKIKGTFKMMAAQHYKEIQEDLKPDKAKFLENPEKWLIAKEEKFISSKLEEDVNYIAYIEGFLKLIVKNRSPPPSGNLESDVDICTPLFILKTLLVTEDLLRKRQDPMRASLQLQYRLRRFAKKERDRNTIYHNDLSDLQDIPGKFAFRLLDTCISPFEVAKLMRLTEDSSMFVDVLNSENTTLCSSQIFRSIVFQESFGIKTEQKAITWYYVLLRVVLFITCKFFLFLPIFVFDRCFKNYKSKFNVINQFKKFKDEFFSPISSYIADLCNYLILFALLLCVTSDTVPDPAEISYIVGIIKNLTYDGPVNETVNISAVDQCIENRFNATKINNSTVLVCLPLPQISWPEWTLWVCMFSRVLTEIYQGVFNKKKGFFGILKEYLKGDINKVDIVMILLIVSGMYFKLHLYIEGKEFGLYKTYFELSANSDELVSRRVIYTIHFYSAAAMLALVNLFYSCFIFVPGIGPLLRSVQKMFVDLGLILVMLGFFSAGFLMPLYSMIRCYRAVYAIEGDETRTDFDTMKSVSESAMTLAWNIFGSQEYTDSLYESQDRFTTFFMALSLFTYSIVLSVMCLNLLLAMVCSRYQRDVSNKNIDWHFSQFSLLMDYHAGCEDPGYGMPYIFPISIPYTLYCIWCKMRCAGKAEPKVNAQQPTNKFSKLFCEQRVPQMEGEGRSGGVSSTCKQCRQKDNNQSSTSFKYEMITHKRKGSISQ